jgi:CheY-like chemotaxis protein
MEQKSGRNRDTRHLNIQDTSRAPRRTTDPLDYLMPWVIELRVVGTAYVEQLQVRESVLLGRGERGEDAADIDLEPYDAYALGVSRRHARISAHNNRVTIQDLNSSNGTFLNGGLMEPGQEYRLRHGDHLALGKLELQVIFAVMPTSDEPDDTVPIETDIPLIGSGQRVLIVDHDREVANAVGAALERAGFQVMISDSVTDALIRVDEALPQAIVLELMLPDRSGLELINYVRGHKGGEHLPMVAITSLTGGYQMGQATAAGVEVFLPKPVAIDELIRGIGKIIPQMSA